MTPLSLKWRLTIPVALALAVAMVVISALAYANFCELVLSQTDRSLISVGKAIQTIMDDPTLVTDRPNHVKLVLAASADQPREENSPEDAGEQQLTACVWLGNRAKNTIEIGSQPIIGALSDKIRGMAEPPQGQIMSFDMWTSHGRFRVVWLSVVLKDGPGNIAIAQSTEDLYGELHELLWGIIVTALIVVIAMIVMSSMLIVVGLRPIRQTADKLAGITAGNLAQFDWHSLSVPAELQPFVKTVGEMLNRLDATMRQQKIFIADAAHELRTPIAIAKSTLQVALASEHSAEEYRKSLHEATEDMRRLEHLAEELLVLARLDEGADLMQVNNVDLAHLLADLAESYQTQIANAGGRLVCELAPSVVRGDVARLRRLFSNLLDNALRHGPAGGEIRISLRKRESKIEVSVHDEGGNISPVNLPHLFERFYRADNSRSHSTGGAGLGLAIANTIVVQHGGDIRIESNPASGTSVCVVLPSILEKSA
jgi:heavy metal sensor kinase